MNNSNDALFWLCLFGLVVLGVEVYMQVKALSVWLNVSMDAAKDVAIHAAIVAAILGMALFKGFFSRALPFLPCAALFIMAPALSYWAWDFIWPNSEYARNATQTWYGIGWVQWMGIALLGVMGLFVPKWLAEH